MVNVIYMNHSCMFRCNIDEGAFDVFDFVSLVIATSEEDNTAELCGQPAVLYEKFLLHYTLCLGHHLECLEDGRCVWISMILSRL